MAVKTLVPETFGPLQGLRFLSTGTLIAAPFACSLAADLGADVIQFERPGAGDTGWRTIGLMVPTRDGGKISTTWVQERRNFFCVTLDFSKPRGRDLFLKLAEHADVWIESSKPGTYARWGLDDETVHAVNPRLVITHVSGYGQSGDSQYSRRTSYDIVGQAFSGTLYQTGFPDPSPPSRAAPWVGDYLTAYMGFGASLAAVLHARTTGKGQSIDLAQFEAIHRVLGGTMVEYFNLGIVRERSGNRALGFQPFDTFQCSDGWVVLGALGGPHYDNVCRIIGLDPAEPRWQNARTALESIEGIEFDAILRGWVSERTVSEVVATLNAKSIPCSRIMSSKDCAEDPQYRARDVHVEWFDEQAGPVKGIGVVPRFSLTPGKIFRGSVAVGHDNERVYGGLLGIQRSELDELRADKVI